jgi:hypothetical protein
MMVSDLTRRSAAWWKGRHKGLRRNLSHEEGNASWDAVKFGEAPAAAR